MITQYCIKGAETIVEIWLNVPEQDDETASTPNQIESEKSSNQIEEKNVEKRQEIERKLPNETKEKIIGEKTQPKIALTNAKTITANIMQDANGKRFVKFVDKNGKVSLIELVADQKNPKVFKFILPNVQSTNASSSSTITSSASPVTSLSTMPSNLKIANETKPLASNQMKKMQQQSLLKPQISLLKSMANIDDRNVDQKRNVKMLTVGIDNRKVNVFVPTSTATSSVVSSIKTIESKSIAFERNFSRIDCFASQTNAIIWLLKRLPLIAYDEIERKRLNDFPFVAENFMKFSKMSLPKQRSYEVKKKNK